MGRLIEVPQPKTTMVDPASGRIRREWHVWFREMFRLIGVAIDDGEAIDAVLGALLARIAQAFVAIEEANQRIAIIHAMPGPTVTDLTVRLATLEGMVAQLLPLRGRMTALESRASGLETLTVALG